MLYFKVLQEGIADMPQSDLAFREDVYHRAKQQGWAVLHAELAQVDAKAAERIHPNDSQRIARALEVYHLTGRALSDFQAETAWGRDEAQPFELASLALMTDNRSLLHQRIELRFQQMLEQGLVAEVQRLKEKFPMQAELPAMKAVGYRQVWQYLEGEFNEGEMLQRGVAATRQLAKRQITWLRSWPNLSSFDMEAPDVFGQLSSKVSELLEKQR